MTGGELTAEAGRCPYDDLLEAQRFRDFLPTRNGMLVFGLVGHDGAWDAGGEASSAGTGGPGGRGVASA